MATIKSYTDILQSKKLAEILPLKTADMYWDYCYDGQKYEYYPMIMDDQFDDVCIPCWSLAALLAFLPNSAFLERGSVTELYRVTLPVELEGSDWYIEPLDACYKMIIRLNELKML